MPRLAALRTAIVLACLLIFGAANAAHANQQSEKLRERGVGELYNLDVERATATFREAVAADPQDPAAHRGLAIALWMKMSFSRGNMTVDDYLGGVSVNRQATAGRTPSPEAASAFNAALETALGLARKRVEAAPRDADAHYQIGTALGLRASYIATVEGSAGRAFRAARDAYNAQERVLDLDPGRKDAGLIVGTYRYIVSALGLPLRMAAYIAGFGGGKARGIRMIEDAAEYHGDNQDDARFSLVLLYNREKRYDDALRQLELLRGRYPRNRLIWLEIGSTQLRAGRAAEAERVLTDRFARFAEDRRERMFGEEALAHYKRGLARVALKRPADAEQDFRQSIAVEGRKWVHGRAHLEIGKLLLSAGRRADANRAFQTAAMLGDADNDRGTADAARRLTQ